MLHTIYMPRRTPEDREQCAMMVLLALMAFAMAFFVVLVYLDPDVADLGLPGGNDLNPGDVYVGSATIVAFAVFGSFFTLRSIIGGDEQDPKVYARKKKIFKWMMVFILYLVGALVALMSLMCCMRPEPLVPLFGIVTVMCLVCMMLALFRYHYPSKESN